MMWKTNALSRRFNLSAPIIQGPFGGGLSSIDLVVAVAQAGALASYGANNLDAQGIRDVAQKIRARTPKPFALNIWVPQDDSDDPQIDDQSFARAVALLQPYFSELNLPLPTRPARFAPPYDEQVEAMFEVRPAILSFVFGVPASNILERCRELNIVTIGTATTVDEALALDTAGIDMIVATGLEAGGHRVSFLKPAQESLVGSFALVPQVVDAVRVPVIAAGGIADARGIAAAMMLGATGVQIGTAFLACRESNAGPLHQELLLSESAKDTALTRVFSGRLARGMRNRMMSELEPFAADIPQYPIQNWLTGVLKKAAREQNRDDLMSLWCGQAASLISHRNASSLVTSLIAETDKLLT